MDTQSTLGTAGPVFRNVFKGITDEMQACIQNCLQCAQVCEQMVQHCLGLGGAYAKPENIRVLQDCADICGTAARFMIRSSSFHAKTCAVCAEACAACAAACEKVTNDPMMKNCAEICRHCADRCKRMAAA